MFQAIRKACPEIFEVHLDAPTRTLTVRVNRTLIKSAGRPALGNLLLRLHISRCTADVTRCRALMDELTEPSPESLEWRRILLDAKASMRFLVQPNTFLDGADAVLRDHEPSAQGMVQSWAERGMRIARRVQSFIIIYELGLGVTIAYEENSSDVTLVDKRCLLWSSCTHKSTMGTSNFFGRRCTNFRSCAMNTSKSSGDMCTCHLSSSEKCVARLHQKSEHTSQSMKSELKMHCPTIVATNVPPLWHMRLRTIRPDRKIALSI